MYYNHNYLQYNPNSNPKKKSTLDEQVVRRRVWRAVRRVRRVH